MNPSNFALADHKLFPLDSAAFTKTSAEMFTRQQEKLPVADQLMAIRKIAAAGAVFAVDNEAMRSVAAIANARLSETFDAAMSMRKSACVDPAARSEAEALSRAGRKSMEFPEWRDMLDILCVKVADFDAKWNLVDNRDIPDPVTTVFRKMASADETIITESAAGGHHHMTPAVLANFPKVAESARAVISPEAMKAAESWDAYTKADLDTQQVIADCLIDYIA